MENKQTAVEWLKDRFQKSEMSDEELYPQFRYFKSILQQALELEKQQIIEANETYSQNGNDYYSQTYKISKNGE